MGNFLTKAGGPLFDPIRDKTVNSKPGGMFYDPLRDFSAKNATNPGGALYDPVRDAIMKGGSGTVPQQYLQGLTPGEVGARGNYQIDPQSGKMIPMQQPGIPTGIGGIPHGVPGYAPQPNVPTGMAGGNMSPAPQTGGGMPLPDDPAAQAAMAMLAAGGKGVGQPPMRMAPRSMNVSSGYQPIMRQPGYDN